MRVHVVLIAMLTAAAPLSAAAGADRSGVDKQVPHKCTKSICKIPPNHWEKLKEKREAAIIRRKANALSKNGNGVPKK